MMFHFLITPVFPGVALLTSFMFQPADVYDLGNIQLEFKTHTATKSSKTQALPCYSLP